jgi:DNA invertase Pin-like site-specific DNA recombinase
VSTEEQGASGLGLASQRSAIAIEVDHRGWSLVGIFEDAAASGSKLLGRPGLDSALAMLKGGEAEVLIVAKLDRLTRSVGDFALLIARARKEGWALSALDLQVDTSTPHGEAMSHIVATFSQLERRLIGQRTKEALAQARLRGVRLGAPIQVDEALQSRIVRLRAQGATLQAIADSLNGDGVPTPRAKPGAIWRHTTILQILRRLDGGSVENA